MYYISGQLLSGRLIPSGSTSRPPSYAMTSTPSQGPAVSCRPPMGERISSFLCSPSSQLCHSVLYREVDLRSSYLSYETTKLDIGIFSSVSPSFIYEQITWISFSYIHALNTCT